MSFSDRRVVITGIGVLSPLGTLDDFWDGLVHGRSGIGPITHFDTEPYATKFGGEVPGFDPLPYFKNPKDAKRADRYAQMGMAVSKMALEDSGLDLNTLDLTRFGVIIGSGIGGLATLEVQHGVLLDRGPRKVSPFTIPMMIENMGSGMVSMEYGLLGPNFTLVTACATANHSVGEAWRLIKTDEGDFFLAGGTEASITSLGVAAFNTMRALSTRNDEPQKASRPFDRDRDGFVMGEGAGVVLLEELEHAKKRGARIYCELTGYGLSSDAYHMTSPAPDGNGARRCMEGALRHASLNPDDLEYINAHGTSTEVGDICETRAIKDLFKDHARNGLMVSSTKSMTGHLLGAAGGVELAACIMALQHGIIPPTINLDNPDPECDLDYVPHTAREKPIKHALSNSFGFGGHNASVLVSKFEG